MKTTLSLSTLALLISLTIPAAQSLVSAAPTPPLPADLQLVPSDALPTHASWWSVQRWGTRPGSPINWCRGRTDVLYYRSPSFGTNKIIIDDELVDYSQTATLSAQMENSNTPAPLAPFGPNDLWLEIQFHTNAANMVDIILHGTTNWSVWKLLSKTDLTTTNAWTLREIQINDETTNTLYFGPFPDDNPTVNFFRAESLTNLFITVATAPSPVGIDYHPPRQSLVFAANFDRTNTPAFGILNSNAVYADWSGIGSLEQGWEMRIATVKTTANGFNAGDLFFSSTNFPATVGWLSADGTTSNLNWAVITDDPNYIEDLNIDQTGVWGNDLLAVAGQDQLSYPSPLNIWRIHSPTNVHLVTSVVTVHLEGLLTVPTNSSYGPWAGKLLTADQNADAIFAVDPSGTVVTNYLATNFGIDCIRLIPTNQDLYCVNFYRPTSYVLKVPRQFFNHYWGDILMVQSGETGAPPTLFIVHWNGTSFDVHSIPLYNFMPDGGWFDRAAFAPIHLFPDP